jgi:hypothetical protein
MVGASIVKVAKIVSVALPVKLAGLILGRVCAERIQESSAIGLVDREQKSASSWPWQYDLPFSIIT